MRNTRLIRIFVALSIMLTGIVMLIISWGKWPDVLVDFGRELYVPWRLSEGEVLYQDIMYFNGPLSPYLNAFWFLLFGTSFYAIVYANIAILSIIVTALFFNLRYSSSLFSTWLACIVFLLMFSFNQYVGIGNYNFICPYSHETTHGMLFSLVGLLFATLYIKTKKKIFFTLAGITLGLIFLTKPEFFFAALLSIGIQLTIFTWQSHHSLRSVVLICFAIIALLALPPLIVFILFDRIFEWPQSISGVLGGWNYIWDSRIFELPFYKVRMGFDQPMTNLYRMLSVFVFYLIPFIPGVVAAFIVKSKKFEVISCVFSLLILLIYAYKFRHAPYFYDSGRALPVFMLLALFWILLKKLKKHDVGGLSALSFVIFSFLLLGKMLLFASFWHYGFALSMPAMMIFIVLLVDWIPNKIRNIGKRPLFFQITAVATILMIAFWHVDVSQKIYATKTTNVGQGADQFYSDQKGEVINQTVNWLKKNTKTDDTLTALPEGIILNYLARRENPAHATSFMPPELIMFGEYRLLEVLENAPPNYIALVHKDTSEYGSPFFGKHYGKSIMDWLINNYQAIYLVGHSPLQDKNFGIEISKLSK